MKILITNCQLRKTFDIFNIVKRTISSKNIIITSNKVSLTSWFIYKKRNYLLRESSYDIFVKDLKKILNTFKKEKIVYLPIEESTTLLFLKLIKNNKIDHLKYLLPSFENFLVARNKKKLMEFCHQNGIPAPKLFSKQQILQNNRAKNFTPVICKPAIGSGAKGIVIINTPSDIKKLSKIDEGKYVIEELLPNGKDVHGSFFLMQKGKLIDAYGHKRIRTFPTIGGVTVYSKIDINKQIVSIGSNLLRKLNWSGFAMIEYLWDPKEKIYKVIEINPRLWGSILLSEFANTKFIENYINLCIDKPVVVSNIDLTVKIRWLLFDVLNLINSRITFREFFTLNRKTTCYINRTYADWWSVFWFNFFFIVNISNVKKILQKWRKK